MQLELLCSIVRFQIVRFYTSIYSSEVNPTRVLNDFPSRLMRFHLTVQVFSKRMLCYGHFSIWKGWILIEVDVSLRLDLRLKVIYKLLICVFGLDL